MRLQMYVECFTGIYHQLIVYSCPARSWSAHAVYRIAELGAISTGKVACQLTLVRFLTLLVLLHRKWHILYADHCSQAVAPRTISPHLQGWKDAMGLYRPYHACQPMGYRLYLHWLVSLLSCARSMGPLHWRKVLRLWL
jgi:hypothetical protein